MSVLILFATLLIATLLIAAVVYLFKTPEYLKGSKWIGRYHTVKDKLKLQIVHTPENVKVLCGNLNLTASKLLSIQGCINNTSFCGTPLLIKPDMSNKEFENAIRKAGLTIESKTLRPAPIQDHGM